MLIPLQLSAFDLTLNSRFGPQGRDCVNLRRYLSSNRDVEFLFSLSSDAREHSGSSFTA